MSARRKGRILIADDEYVISRCVSFMLKKEGFDCRIASDGEAALALMRAEPPDMVILDLDMPKKNGFDVCREMRQDEALREVHVLVLTAKGQPMSRDWRSRIEADSFMLKPFDPRALLLHVEQHFERLRLMAEAEASHDLSHSSETAPEHDPDAVVTPR